MTSINAIRFNHYEGACICDESISSTDDMRMDVSDKIRPCVPAVITAKYGIVAAMGTTGSCSFGDEMKQTVATRIGKIYEDEVEKHGRPPANFIGLDQIAAIMFDIIVESKEKSMSRKFMGEYGFSVSEFIEGTYTRNDKNFDIKDKDTIKEVTALLHWKYQQAEVSSIFLNACLLAGYDPSNGFEIFHFDLRAGYWHKVQTCYLAEGSGRISVDPTMAHFVENLMVANRRSDVDRVAGIMWLIHGLNCAMDHDIGVGGYPSVILIDGKQDPTQRLREINDERTRLAGQIMRCVTWNYLSYQDGYSMIDSLLFGTAGFEETYENLFAKVRNPKAAMRLLRGYKIVPYHEDIEITI